MARIEYVMGYQFDGAYSINADFNPVAGIYIITNTAGNIVDVGETDNLKNRIPNHERRDCWASNGGLNLWFHHENDYNQRLLKEKAIRDANHPVCGIQ